MSNTTSINSELFVNLLQAAQYSAYETSIVRSISTVFDQPTGTGTRIQIPVWASISAEKPGEGVDATAADTNTTASYIDIAEHVVYHKVTDFMRDSASNVLGQLGDQAGRAIAESIDSDAFALFTAFDEVGPGAGATLKVESILRGAAVLRSRKLTGPFFAIVNPLQAYALKKELASNGGNNIPNLSNIGNQVLQAGYLGVVGGVYVFESGLIPINGNADSTGAIVSSMALGHAMRGGVTLETQRQAKGRATDLVLTAVAGSSVIRQSYGLKLTSDAS